MNICDCLYVFLLIALFITIIITITKKGYLLLTFWCLNPS